MVQHLITRGFIFSNSSSNSLLLIGQAAFCGHPASNSVGNAGSFPGGQSDHGVKLATSETRIGMSGAISPPTYILVACTRAITVHCHDIKYVYYNYALSTKVVKVLCYKSEGRWFDSRWCHWNFSPT